MGDCHGAPLKSNHAEHTKDPLGQKRYVRSSNKMKLPTILENSEYPYLEYSASNHADY